MNSEKKMALPAENSLNGSQFFPVILMPQKVLEMENHWGPLNVVH